MSMVGLGEWFAAMERMNVMVDRANMWAVREAGRQVKGFAREDAPVYSGALRRSITSSRNLRNPAEHEYQLSVGPHGAPMYKYSGKQEGTHHYMETAKNDVAGNMAGIVEKAQRVVLGMYA